MSTRDLTILGCSSQQPTRRRNHGAYLLRWNNEGILLDPGEGTQRQFIYANTSPTCVQRILISHFHGDHCLGLGSMLMRLNLDKVTHPIHCYYPANGKVFFDRLRYSCIYHENIEVIEHPVRQAGLVDETEHYTIEAHYLQHGVTSLGWRLCEKPVRKFRKEQLDAYGVQGERVRDLQQRGQLRLDDGSLLMLDQVSYMQPGAIFSYVSDTAYCQAAIEVARGAQLFLCESTYLHAQHEMAAKHHHLTAVQAAQIAHTAGAQLLVLTHFSARYQEVEPFTEEACAIFPATIAADDLKRIVLPSPPKVG